ncbi:MAG: hypothetical protein ACFE88_16655 [Candidatus Hermodarchaeota archaeon]
MIPLRFIMLVVGQGAFILIFSILTYKMLSRKKETIVVGFSLFLISVIIASILNIIYSFIVDSSFKVVLHLFTNFFNFFGIGFLYITNQIILKSTLIYTFNKRLKYLISYGVILLVGMFIIAFLTTGVVFNNEGFPIWNPYFFLFMVITVYSYSIIPVTYTSWQILKELPKDETKKKYIALFIGTIGLGLLPILVFTANFLNIYMFRIFVSIIYMTILLWTYLFYFALGRNLRNE